MKLWKSALFGSGNTRCEFRRRSFGEGPSRQKITWRSCCQASSWLPDRFKVHEVLFRLFAFWDSMSFRVFHLQLDISHDFAATTLR